MRHLKLYTGEKIPVICQGCASVSDNQLPIWKKALELGSNSFDTAEAYDFGGSERSLSLLLKEVSRDSVLISSKVSPENLRPDKLVISCESSLKRLETDYIDIYYIHWTNPLVPLEDSLSIMEKLVTQGKIKYIGLSNFTLFQIKEACRYSTIGSVQMEYNLKNRNCESKIIPFCHENNIIFQAYTPLNFGNIHNDVLDKMALKYNKSSFSIVLNWMIKNNICVIPKTSKLTHLIDNCTSVDYELDKEEYQSIDKCFSYNLQKIKCNEITPIFSGGEYPNVVYNTIEEALENRFNYSPSPKDLSYELLKTKELSKPIHVKIEDNKKFLVGGNVRYWGWVIAFGILSEIECLIIK